VSASPYAWIIDKDHLYDGPDSICPDEQGVIGPRGADIDNTPRSYAENKAELARNYQHHHQFRMYDDDEELYYTGTLFWNGDAECPWNDSDDFNYGPLRDYGMPNAGAVTISYTGRPQWDCG